jgi:hypothetical protein
MSDAEIAAIIALPLSSLIVAIQITQASNSSLQRAVRGSTLLYFLIVFVGNVFTTFLAAATTSQTIPMGVAPAWFWYAFLGVFGFEAILKNLNLTFAEIGVLSINDWITKAKDAAVADVIEVDVMYKLQMANALAAKLKTLPVNELNAHVSHILGNGQVVALDAAAITESADPQLMKALALAKGNYKAALAISPN